METKADAPNGFGRAPRGARGLKSLAPQRLRRQVPSRPARGAWIEIKSYTKYLPQITVAPREGRVD